MEHPHWRIYKESKQTLILPTGMSSSKSTNQSGFNMLWNQIKTGSGYAVPIGGGLAQYLTDELESIQTRNLKIIGLPSDSLQSLEQRRDNLVIREYKKIINDETHRVGNIYLT